MMTDEKLLIMFDLAQEQQQMVKDLINDTKELQRIVESKTYASIQTTAKAVGELSTSEVKSNIEKYEKSLESLLAKTVQVNQQLENATQRFNYKIMTGFAMFAMACVIGTLCTYIWLDNKISDQLETIATLKAQGGDLQFSTCDGRTCIKVYDKPTYGKDGEYRIVILK